MITGTVRNAVKMQELNNKWLLKKSEIGKSKKDMANMTPEERKLQHFLDQAADIREGNKFAEIDAKIKAGGSLTEEKEKREAMGCETDLTETENTEENWQAEESKPMGENNDNEQTELSEKKSFRMGCPG